MARNYRQRFDVTSSSGSAPRPGTDAYDEILKAEAKAIDDFRKKLITADDAMAEFATSVRRFGRNAGMTVESRQADADRMEGILDRLAASMGQAGVTKAPVKAKEKSEEDQARDEMWERVHAAIDAFKNKLITADEAIERTNRAFDEMGEKAKYTLMERWEEKEWAKEQVEKTAQETRQPGATAEEQDDGVLGKLFKQFGLDSKLGGQLGGVLGKLIPGGGQLGKLLGKGGLLEMFGGGGEAGIGEGFGSALGGGAAGGLAQFAGPAAIVAIGAKIMTQFYSGVADTTKKLGDVGTSIAKNDGVGAITGVMDAWGKAYKKVPIVGEMLDAEIGMYSQFIKTFDQVTAAFEQRGRELKGYSGGIASADANSNVVKLLADIKEAQELDAEYSAIITERTTMQVELQQALTPIKRIIMQDLVQLLRFVNANLKAVNVVMTDLDQSIKNVQENTNGMLGSATDLLLLLSPAIGIFIKVFGASKEENKNELLDRLYQIGNADLGVSDENVTRLERPMPVNLFQ